MSDNFWGPGTHFHHILAHFNHWASQQVLCIDRPWTRTADILTWHIQLKVLDVNWASYLAERGTMLAQSGLTLSGCKAVKVMISFAADLTVYAEMFFVIKCAFVNILQCFFHHSLDSNSLAPGRESARKSCCISPQRFSGLGLPCRTWENWWIKTE